MNLKEYIKFRLNNRKKFTVEADKKLLQNIYNEMEKRGYHHSEIYATINEVIIENIKKLTKKLKHQLKL